MATAVNANPITAHRIMYDILNEPDSFNIGWQAANGRPGMQDLYPLAMDAIYAINPGIYRAQLGVLAELRTCLRARLFKISNAKCVYMRSFHFPHRGPRSAELRQFELGQWSRH